MMIVKKVKMIVKYLMNQKIKLKGFMIFIKVKTFIYIMILRKKSSL